MVHESPFLRRIPLRHAERWSKALLLFLVPLVLCTAGRLGAQQTSNEVEEINAEFHFLGPDDTLLIHEEEGRLKGQIDVFQNEDESDTVLSYILTIASRKNDHVEFKTAMIHRKYYRFNGAIKRGTGHEEKDADYLRLVGALEIITINEGSGEESVERKDVVLKSLSADEISDE